MATKVYTLMVHSPTHSPEDLIINKDVFPDMVVGDFIKLYLFEGEQSQKTIDPLILKVNTLQSTVGRLEISISKSIADPLNMKPFSRVVVEKVAPEDARVDFVELSFRKQFLTRGNMWRFKNAINGKSVHVHQTVQIDGVQAQVQELGMNCVPKKSGIIFDNSKFIFRSRSARIIWLVQVSKEMWEFDENGDLYFEKFLTKFVNPLLEKWKALQVTHQLSVIFFARSIYLDRVEFIPELSSKASLQQHYWGGNNSINNTTKCQDFYKVVIENTSDIDKVATLKALKEEFWSFAKGVGWNVPVSNSPSNNSFDNLSTSAPPHCVPSDAYDGNFLESINTTLNLMDKHYMDRDLSRSGNSIVMISAGTGIFNVKPQLSQITKQRMMDTGIGIDFISLSQPPMHTVPLFHVDCKGEGVGNFYEVPHWINICFVDCLKDSSTNLKSNMGEVSPRRQRASSNSQRRIIESDLNSRRSYRWTGLDFDDKANSISSYQQSTADLFGITFKPLPFPSILKGHLKAAKFASSEDACTRHSQSNQMLVQSLSIPRLLKKNLKFRNDLSVLSTHSSSSVAEPQGQEKHFHRLYEWGKLPFKQIFQPATSINNLDREMNAYFSETSSKSTFEDLSSHSLKRHAGGEDRKKSQPTCEIGLSTDTEIGLKLVAEAIPELSSSVGASSDGGSFLSSSVERFHSLNMHDPTSPHRIVSQAQHASSSSAQQDKCFWTVVDCKISEDDSRSAMAQYSSDLDKLYESMQSFDSGVFQSTAGPSVGTGSSHWEDSNVANMVGGVSDLSTKTFPHGIAAAGSPHTVHYVSSMHRNGVSSNISPGGLVEAQPFEAAADRDLSSVDHAPGSESYLPIDNYFPQRLERRLSDAASSHRRFDSSSSLIKRRDSDDSMIFPSQLTGTAIHIGPRQTMMSVNNNKAMLMLAKQHSNNHSYSSNSIINTVSSSPAAGGGITGGSGQNIKSQSVASAKVLIREFRRRAQVNPFRKDEGSNYVKSRTHNRRRWSHVFPTGERSDTNGLNWKSLCQPAILPLTTDYLPPVSELLSKYDIQTLYPLIIDPVDSPFKSPEALLQEMVCHRLSMEFQLVEGVDISSYYNFGRGSSNRTSFHATTKSKILIKSAEERNVLYILTMGHRIQFLEYDYTTKQVHVTQLRSRQGINDAERTAKYSYEIYVPQLKAFKTVSQTFYQFPTPEYLWNKADGILLGTVEIDFSGDVTKTKRLRFAIMSDRQQDTNVTFFGKIEKLVAFCNKQCKSSSTNDNVMRVSMLGDDEESSQTHRKKDFDVVNITLKDSSKEPKWAFLKYDKKVSASRIFHVELHWIVCDSWLVDDFVNVLFRRCNTWGMRIIQIPEFFCTANMKLHPFRAQPYIPVPQYQRAIQCEGYPAVVSLVTRLYLEHGESSSCTASNRWWRDDDRLTDWAGIEDTTSSPEEAGPHKPRNSAFNNQSLLAPTNTSTNSALTILSTQLIDPGASHDSMSSIGKQGIVGAASQLTSALVEGAPHHSRPIVTQPSSTNSAVGHAVPALRPQIPASLLSSIAASTKRDFRGGLSNQKKCDVQYMHGYGLASLRQGKRGFIWLSNAGARISDVNLTPDEKKRLTLANMTEFTQHCCSVGDCFEILVDVIEDMLQSSYTGN